MIKIYQAYSEHGKIKLKDYIDFQSGRFDTGLDGFGVVYTDDRSWLRANYELQRLKYFKEYLKRVKIDDGYVEDFTLFNPYNYKTLYEKYKDVPKEMEAYEEYGLNEEAIMLFTDYVSLTDYSEEKVKRIFGRYLPHSMYLILPNAKLTMYTGELKKEGNIEKYEVLQSDSLGRSLTLNKISRLDLIK